MADEKTEEAPKKRVSALVPIKVKAGYQIKNGREIIEGGKKGMISPELVEQYRGRILIKVKGEKGPRYVEVPPKDRNHPGRSLHRMIESPTKG